LKELNEITAEALFYGSLIDATRTGGKSERRCDRAKMARVVQHDGCMARGELATDN